jgi:hypothetical protein
VIIKENALEGFQNLRKLLRIKGMSRAQLKHFATHPEDFKDQV